MERREEQLRAAAFIEQLDVAFCDPQIEPAQHSKSKNGPAIVSRLLGMQWLKEYRLATQLRHQEHGEDAAQVQGTGERCRSPDSSTGVQGEMPVLEASAAIRIGSARIAGAE